MLLFASYIKRKKFNIFIRSKTFNELFNKSDLLINRDSFLIKKNNFFKNNRLLHKTVSKNKFNTFNSSSISTGYTTKRNIYNNFNYKNKNFILHKFNVFNELNYKIFMYLESRNIFKKNRYEKRLNNINFKYFKTNIFYKTSRYTTYFKFYDNLNLGIGGNKSFLNKKNSYFLNLKLTKRNKSKGNINYVMKKISNSFNYDAILKEQESRFFNSKYFSKYYLPTKNREKLRNKFFPKMVRRTYFNLSK